MRRRKLGLVEWRDEYEESLWRPLYSLLQGLDYTIFFRQLAHLEPAMLDQSDQELLAVVHAPAAYPDAQGEDKAAEVAKWLRDWLMARRDQPGEDPAAMAQMMRQASPHQASTLFLNLSV